MMILDSGLLFEPPGIYACKHQRYTVLTSRIQERSEVKTRENLMYCNII